MSIIPAQLRGLLSDENYSHVLSSADGFQSAPVGTRELEVQTLISSYTAAISQRDRIIAVLSDRSDELEWKRECSEKDKAQMELKITKLKESLRECEEKVRNRNKAVDVWEQRRDKVQHHLSVLRAKHPEVDFTELADVLSLNITT